MALPGRSTLDHAIVRLLPAVPRPFVRRLSSRYIAGPSIDDAIRVVERLNAKGKMATVDVLGEEITSPDEARAIAGQYHDVLARIDEEGLDSNVSVKLTGLGLDLDFDLCREIVEAIVSDAHARSNFVRIDMEDSTTTDRTLGLYHELRKLGHENIGAVVQAYLRRTADDVRDLDNVRICKGIYVEPEEIAYTDYEEVRANYVRVLEQVLRSGTYVGIATHDEFLIGEALRLVDGVPLRPLRVPDAARRALRPGRRAGRRRPPRADLRPVRDAVVRVLGQAAAGEPGDRGLRRLGHGGPPLRASLAAAGPDEPRPVSDTVRKVLGRSRPIRG